MSAPTTCPWCGYERCHGTTRHYPHHSLCCMDNRNGPLPGSCRAPDTEAADRINAVLREDHYE